MSYPICVTFQFTHPGKGATKPPEGEIFTFDVSIHAPWEGCDAVSLTERVTALQFQFTHPGKGATRSVGYLVRCPKFQFTHPGKGATASNAGKLSFTTTFQFTHPGKGATIS